MNLKKLNIEDLKASSDPSLFPFKTTEDYIFDNEPPHQERGVNAIEFGLNIKAEGYNIFVCGSNGTGRNTQVKKAVYEIASREKTPGDWLYVYNFAQEDEPLAITLPAGMGKTFKKDIEEMISELKIEIPKSFESEDYEKRKHVLIKEYKQKRENVLDEIEKKAFEEGFVLKQSATGVILVPRVNTKPMEPSEYEKLPDNEKEKIERKKSELHILIEQVLTEVRVMEKDVKKNIKELEKEVTLFAVRHIIDDLRAKYKEYEDIIQHLNRVQKNIISNLDSFKEEEEMPAQNFLGVKNITKENVFKRYEINLLVDNSEIKGAPIVIEPNPTYYNLLGRIEYVAQFGSMTTDFSMISAGDLHKANGGYLILQAMDLATTFMSWDALKKVIKNHQIKMEDINEQFRIISTTSLKPQPIPSDIKIVMIGPPWLYEMLYRYDEDFRKMFKIKADFSREMDKDSEKIKKYISFIKARCEEEQLRHFDRNAVAKIVEYGSRLVEDKNKLSAHFVAIADIARESNFWAGKDNAKYVHDKHVEKAIQEKIYRSNLIEEKISELINNNVLMIDVAGEKIGQINGLAVYEIGGYSFGKPSRITVSTYIGKSGVIDIERQVNMGGNIHSKGVMILSGYFGQKFAQEQPLNFTANICFEQSYDGIEGDSASSTEAYCLLSSLSGVPLKQYIAVTGSMNQHGEIQPVGGINQKIEGFYHVCKIKGLTNEQGVLIPQANVQHLMLKDEVIKAVQEGKFHIWAVSSLDEGIEILTGKTAGEKTSDGKYPKDTINFIVNEKLKDFAKKSAHPPKTKKPKQIETINSLKNTP
ncbi:peptidase S16 lon domain-containing protein [Candidatus Omnitrophus magneticus]|uniref:endopeptidase La n=1 Tax=Candidatus Omnitrophus magneticus TaxID=1609969 RepID=A0A0F0CPU0_9BACT|nr:peptidase S16 lon domain-containing protein [Candidatus Omnitrophus magneticus]